MERRGGCSRLGEFAKSKRISGCQRSSWEKAGFLYVPPPSNHQTSWRYNHLILHHYGLSNFIKPHTWFQLCCSITTFPLTITLDFTTLYRTASVDVLLLKRSTRTGVCSARSLPWHCLCEDVDLIFLRRPFELMLAPATSCTWLAVAWSWHWLWMWYYEVFFSRSGVVNTPWEPVFSCGFPVPSAISSRSKELTVAWKSGGKVCAYLQVNVFVWVVSHFYSSWVDPEVCICMHRYVCERERVFGRSPCPSVLLRTACQRVEPDARSEDDIQPKAL